MDFDRGCRRAPARAWKYANLSRLDRSLHKVAGGAGDLSAGWDKLLQGYQS
ncbi:MAG TPA: lipopolysaccharide kinase InaA family protein [Gammaproteobacteria bacterium]|nr:lipopolysaccharide kinase InaA family protein [Gammaproteobacteria bacterium]